MREVLDVLVTSGAPRSILYDAKPHIGSNLLPSVVRRMRRRMAECGADFCFSTRMTSLVVDGGRFANSGFVITLDPDRFPDEGVLAGIELQEKIETRAATLAEHPFGAPALRLVDFLDEVLTVGALPESSCPMPLSIAPFEEFLPPAVLDPLRVGLSTLCERLPILRHPEAVIVGPESRCSCPVRILRDRESLQSPSSAGLHPMGEGPGYAGGIVSASVDGLRCAEAYLAKQ